MVICPLLHSEQSSSSSRLVELLAGRLHISSQKCECKGVIAAFQEHNAALSPLPLLLFLALQSEVVRLRRWERGHLNAGSEPVPAARPPPPPPSMSKVHRAKALILRQARPIPSPHAHTHMRCHCKPFILRVEWQMRECRWYGVSTVP